MTHRDQGDLRRAGTFSQHSTSRQPSRFTVPDHSGQANEAMSAKSRRHPGRFAQQSGRSLSSARVVG